MEVTISFDHEHATFHTKLSIQQDIYTSLFLKKRTMFNVATRTLTKHLTTTTTLLNSTTLKSNFSMSSTTASLPQSGKTPGEQFEVRQTSSTEDWHRNPSKSIPLDRARQALVDDIIALYSCEPTIERVKRYTPDCVYDDQFVYANDRYGLFCSLAGLSLGIGCEDVEVG